MKLIITEKPSVAKIISKSINATSFKNGYIEGNGYIISWCVGHLLELVSPEEYDDKFKNWGVLPIIPDYYKYKIKESTKNQFEVLKKLLNDDKITSIICATDAGREGELIFRNVYNITNCKKPFERLWISSLEDESIKQGLSNLKPGCEYDNLYFSAVCREQADWLVGINFSRLFTSLYNASPSLSIGRVQTPTLATITMRDEEIANFTKKKFYKVQLKNDNFTAISERLDNDALAKNLCDKCNSIKFATVITSEKKAVTDKPPKLYDLTSLQRDANKLYGFTAQQTLDAAQRLYDRTLATYPRTDSNYLTEDMYDSTVHLIEIVKAKFSELNLNNNEPNVQVLINNKKVSDHHALLPTANISKFDFNELSDTDRKILYLISKRLIVASSKPHKYDKTIVTINCAENDFTATGKTIVEQGYKIFDNYNQDDSTQVLPVLTKGEQLSIVAEITEHYTTAPKPYTEDTLLSAMERAGNAEYNSDEVERKGLGTPATRAGIIETLVKKGYVERNKKQLISTALGKTLISIVPEKLKSATMTADWENDLLLVSKGQLSKDIFINNIKEYVKSIVSESSNIAEYNDFFKSKNNKEVIGKCPRCGNNIYEDKLKFYCSNKNCNFALWKDNKFFKSKKKTITKSICKSLLKNGKVHIKDLWSENKQKTYEADILLNDTDEKYVNFKLEFDNKK